MREFRAHPAVIERALVPSLFVAVAAGALLLGHIVRGSRDSSLTLTFLGKQDVWLALAGIAVLLASLIRPSARSVLPELRTRTVLFAAGIMAIFALAGRYVVMLDYDMSRDEQMASFDARIFSAGRLVAPLREPWIEHADALNTLFMLPVSDRTAWVSGYLPMNAAIRGMFESFGAANLVGPLAILLGAVAIWACARKIWPGDHSAAVLALLLYVGSGQVLVNGMTAYAMPLHLTANLAWLWLFLQNRLRADLLALCVAFIAVGLHQPVFHPIFALPILVGVVIERDWRRAAVFFFGYLLIGAFWFWWPNYSVGLTGTPLPGGEADFLTRLTQELFREQRGGLPEMLANLVRFVSWQHLLLLPLLLIGIRNLGKDRLMAGLAGGIALTIIVMAIILPYQGHGFGYRYLHGLIGNAILLAVLGWQKVRTEFPQWNSLILRTTVAGLLVILPLQLYFAHAFYAPYAQASRAIDASVADYVLVDWTRAPFANDLVINDPWLANRPIRLLEQFADEALLSAICKDGATVTRLPAPYYDNIREYFGRPERATVRAGNEELTTLIQESGCKLI